MTKTKTWDKVSLGIALIGLGVILVVGSFGVKRSQSNTFASEPVKVEGFSVKDAPLEKLPVRILIPALSIDLEVKPARNINGYWEVFSDSAAWGEGSGLPGEQGNQVIYAHARRGLFLPLKGVQEGMKIYVFSSNNWYLYEVSQIKEVTPTQVGVIAPTEDETLTLYTCSGFADSKRLIVIAKKAS